MELFIAGLFLIDFAVLWLIYMVLNNRIQKFLDESTVDAEDASRPIRTLITEFNKVSHINIHTLEERQKELKQIIQLADEKTRRLNLVISELEHLVGHISDIDNANGQVEPVPVYQKVYHLHKEGKGIEEICKELSIGKDEAEFSLSLAKQKYSTGG